MDLREFKIQFLNAKVVTDDIKIMFRTPDCYAYYDCNCHIAKYENKDILMIDLIDKIKPIFKVGDIVCNNGGLHPNVKCTITEVNEELQYYSYKEVNGRTYFKNQDKLKLVSIEPKFHVGDVVTNISGLYPNISPTISEVDIVNQCYRYKEIGGITWFKEQDKLKLVNTKPIFKVGDKVKGASSEEPKKEFIINSVNEDIKCYHYFNGNGIITMFKDQHKLTLVQTDNCSHPVEGDAKSASTVKINPNIISVDELRHNKDIYDIYDLMVQEMMCAIKHNAKQGKSKAHFTIITRDVSVFQLGQDFTNAGYKVSAVIGNDKNSTLDIEW